jgi:hypothetical protein
MSTCALRSAATDGGYLAEGRIACAARTSAKVYEMVDRTLDATVSSIMPTFLKRSSQGLLSGKHLTLRCLVFFPKAETL